MLREHGIMALRIWPALGLCLLLFGFGDIAAQASASGSGEADSEEGAQKPEDKKAQEPEEIRCYGVAPAYQNENTVYTPDGIKYHAGKLPYGCHPRAFLRIPRKECRHHQAGVDQENKTVNGSPEEEAEFGDLKKCWPYDKFGTTKKRELVNDPTSLIAMGEDEQTR